MSYRLQERINGGTWSTIQNTSSTSRALSGKTPGTWEYRVRAENVIGNSSYSGIRSVAVSAPATPGTPSGPTTNYTGGYTISWGAVTGAAIYRLQERISGGTWTTIQSTSSTSRAISGKTAGTWEYRVRAESGAGNSSFSGTRSVVVSAPATPGTPSGPTGSEYTGAYTISWSSVAGAVTYRLEERPSGGSWSTIQNTSSTSKAVTGKTPGTWEYRVRAENVIGNSSYSGTKSVAVSAPAKPGTPSGPTTNYTGGYTISWSAVTGAATYRLQERISGGSWATIQNTSSTSSVISGKTDGTWQYRVRAESGAGNSSYSNTKSVQVVLPPTTTGVTPGAIPGGFAVGTQGDAGYSVPITAPAGAGGLQPSLALTYNHLAGDGLAGMRWTLSGIPTITRCQQTYAQDGVVGGSYSRYCLNGQRLVNIGSGQYHASGTEYRTEVESFQRIVQVGTQGGGAQSFYIDHGDGRRSYFGETSASRATGPGGAVRIWYISRTRDQFGNEIVYDYQSPTPEETLPKEIVWTRNTGAGLTPRYKVAITYANRPTDDRRSGYDGGGAQWSRTERIQKIDVTYDNGQTVQSIATYALSYKTPAATGTGRSQLEEISVCRGTDCLPETVFSVQDGTRGWYLMLNTSRSIGAHPMVGDWNGNGRQDLFVSLSNTWWVYPGRVDAGLDAAINSGASSTTNPSQARVIDYDGDGRADLLYQSGSTWYVVKSTGTGFGSPINTGISTSAMANPSVMDLDGDGLADLVYQFAGSLYWRRNTGSGFASQQGIYTPVGSLSGYFVVPTVDAAIRALDVNGDGRADLVVHVEECSYFPPDLEYCENAYNLLLSTGTGWQTFTEIEVARVPEGYHLSNFRAIDVNGDGLDDLLYVSDLDSSTWRLKLSRGTTLGPQINTNIPTTNADKVLITDYDGDGREDLIRPDGNFYRIHRSNGETLPSSPTESLSSSGAGTAAAFMADISGSGYPELVRTSGSTWWRHTHKSALADVVTSFTDGLGRTVEVEYGSLAQSPAQNPYYTLDAGHTPSESRVRRYAGPRYVVTTETHDDGLGDTRSRLHTYDTAFVSTAGRGWQSFRKHRVDDPVLGLYTETEYDQTFPTAGMAKAVKQRTIAGNKDIRLVDHTLAVTSMSGTTPQRRFRTPASRAR